MKSPFKGKEMGSKEANGMTGQAWIRIILY